MNIVKIGAMWCPGCIVMQKVWTEVERRYPDVKIKSLDIDMDVEETAQYHVGAVLPVIIFFKNGHEYKRLIGEKKYSEVEEVILEMRNNK